MHLCSWILALYLLWHSMLAITHAVSLTFVEPTSSASKSNGRMDSYFWPFWTITDGITNGTSDSVSLFPLPFKLPFNFWSASPQSEEDTRHEDTLAAASIQFNKPTPGGLWEKPQIATTAITLETFLTATAQKTQPTFSPDTTTRTIVYGHPSPKRPTKQTVSYQSSARTKVSTSPPDKYSTITDPALSPVQSIYFPDQIDGGTQHPLDDGSQITAKQVKGTGTTILENKTCGDTVKESKLIITASVPGTTAPDQYLDSPGNTQDLDIDINGTSNQSHNPYLIPAPAMFVPLYSDWNSAMATWGMAWEAHIYGLGSLFALVAFLSTLNLLCLPFCCPFGCIYFVLVDLFLLAAGCGRGFALFYDAYSHQDKLPLLGMLLLYEAPFPCLTATFGLVFLLLSMRSRMQLPQSVFLRPGFLATLVVLHFLVALGSVGLLQLKPQLTCLAFVAQGAFVVLAVFLSSSYLIFYCYIRADAKHFYHLNNSSPGSEQLNCCPFSNPREWEQGAGMTVVATFFLVASAGLQLYAMLHALGLVALQVFPPWPWWAFQLGCRVCEVGLCLTLTMVVIYPTCCPSTSPSQANCWSSSRKQSPLNNSYPWSLAQQEKLVISECLPLYTLDLLYQNNSALETEEAVSPPKAQNNPHKTFSVDSLHLDSISTVDLRPPSPIDLQLSIDEALFGSQSLFNSTILCSPSSDCILYHTSSNVDMTGAYPQESSSSCLYSTGQWCASSSISHCSPSLAGSALVLCSSPQSYRIPSHGSNSTIPSNLSTDDLNQVVYYQVLEDQSQPVENNLDVQAEFINVCRHIDALSLSSDTIDL